MKLSRTTQFCRGSLLALFQLFLYEGQAKHIAPLKPPHKKQSSRYSVARNVCPIIRNYTVQILCWGVRDLARYQVGCKIAKMTGSDYFKLEELLLSAFGSTF